MLERGVGMLVQKGAQDTHEVPARERCRVDARSLLCVSKEPSVASLVVRLLSPEMTEPMRAFLSMLAIVGIAVAAVVPASGEDAGIYAFFHSQQRERAFPPVQTVPQYAAPHQKWIVPRSRLAKPSLGPRAPKPASPLPSPREKARKVAQPEMPLKARPIGEVTNPVPALLADKTLRPGDIVVFPDGPRLFKGKPRERHALSDFVKITSAKGLAPPARKIVNAMLIGRNDAWSSEPLSSDRVAAAARDVDATGSTRKGRSSRAMSSGEQRSRSPAEAAKSN